MALFFGILLFQPLHFQSCIPLEEAHTLDEPNIHFLVSLKSQSHFGALAAPVPPKYRRADPPKFVLPTPGNDGPGPTFDQTATRAATSSQIRSVASPNTCFDVSNFTAGDFRFNLVPIALAACDSSIDGQKFDLITKGEHNNVADGSRTIIVSSQQLTCVDRRSNINDRTRPGLFACGGRAAGDGETTADQQYFFNSTIAAAGSIAFPLVANSVNNGIGDGNRCLALGADGFLNITACSPPNFTPDQLWAVGGSLPPPSESGSSPIPSSSEIPGASDVPATTSLTGTIKPATAVSTQSAPLPKTFVLPPPGDDGPGPTFDATATRAATGAQIKNVGSPDICFDVSDFDAGDFRFNLVPIALKKCDPSVDGQKFDLITKNFTGRANNVADGSRTIIVSSQQLTCVDRRSNKNDRTRPGLFACGIGFPLVKDAVNDGAGDGNSCLTLNADGFLSNTPCSPPNFSPEQTWIVQ
ncbi:hypothetical protein BD779DRAFT_1525957 [Infundibulicybe gibba]|nr:hypothetical protein BD779DRAFT_1525957 [Infundibulicybe gibba]